MGFANIPFPWEHGSLIPDVKEQAGTLTEHRAVGKGVRPAIAVRAGAILRGRSASAKARGLPDADVALWPHWLAPVEADALFAELRQAVAWETHRIRLFGRELDTPRLSCWIGDPGASYTYSSTRFEPRPWPAALAALRGRLERACAARFNSVLANLYRDGDDAMGWHSDDEPELGAQLRAALRAD